MRLSTSGTGNGGEAERPSVQDNGSCEQKSPNSRGVRLRGERDAKHERYLARHAARDVRAPVNIRQQKTRQFQALLDGSGGKYVHADYVQNGATQIGGCSSMTPSMTPAPKDGQFGTVASKLAAAGPPRIRNLPSDFKVA